MKKSLLFMILGIITSHLAIAQTLTLHDSVHFPFITNGLGDVGSSDCWGWTDPNGVDYAIIGNKDNIAFVRASDAAVLDVEPAPDQLDGYFHRDMVTFEHYCYVVAEMKGNREGLMVFDLSYLPDSVHYVTSIAVSNRFIRSHNMDVDTATAHLYCEGDESLGFSGVEIFSIADRENPVRVGFIPVPGIHDIHARNDTLWVAEGTAKAFSVYDVTDKGNPQLLGRVTDNTFGYCHQIWPTEDGKFFVTTEETPNKTVKVWDATDMNNITLRGTYLGANDLAHNAHVMGDYVFISHYTAGITVIDISDPDAPVEVAAYDTYPQNDIDDFYGCWGAFPYTKDGYVYGSNFEGILFILEWDPQGSVGIDQPSPRGPGLTYPNPFTAVTNIPFELDAPTQVQARVYDLQGRLVAELMDQELSAGKYVLPWRPEATVAGGTYFLHLDAGSASGVKKLELQR